MIHQLLLSWIVRLHQLLSALRVNWLINQLTRTANYLKEAILRINLGASTEKNIKIKKLQFCKYIWYSVTECSLNIVFFLKCCDFSELCQFCCSAGVVFCHIVYALWYQGETERGQSLEYILKSSKKHNISNEHPVYNWNGNFIFNVRR